MNDNELPMTGFWAGRFCGHSEESLRAALAVISGLLDAPEAFERCAAAVRGRLQVEVALRSRMGMRDLILTEVANKHGISVSDIKARRRDRRYSFPRFEAAWRLRTELNLSYPRIGAILGGRDHTTIMSAVERYEELRERIDARDYYTEYQSIQKTSGSVAPA